MAEPTTKQIIALAKLDPIPGRNASSVQIARLIAQQKGESPANDAAVVALLDMPVKKFRAEGKVIFDLLKELTVIEYTDEGGATVGDYTVRPMIGEDLMMLADTSVPVLVQRLTGLTAAQVEELDPRDYLSLAAAVDFLGQDALKDEDSSESP